jgi:hypothetical protein
LCQGSLGDPVVNIGFGSGTGLGSPLPAGVTNYIFTDSPCPDDGYYTVVNKVGDCFGTTWHQLSEDHTPNDVNGYMMLVNASFAPGDFFTTTVNNLCGGTTYEFAAWIVNVLKLNACADGGKKPDVTFRIETPAGNCCNLSVPVIFYLIPFRNGNNMGSFFKHLLMLVLL